MLLPPCALPPGAAVAARVMYVRSAECIAPELARSQSVQYEKEEKEAEREGGV
jgi:hypothetical protein